jgi:peptidoglycan/LPS O-acetylase OafA/YrhL
MKPESGKTRFAFVDALRGVAALWVVVFHAYGKNLLPMTGYRYPEPIHWILNNGFLGVDIFFVISGFVIMQSMLGARVTPSYLGRFALRRSLRLDPPYWATIAAMIVLSYIMNRLQNDHAKLPLPTWDSVVAHLFYLQWFLGYPQIVGVFWTLCYEIQFYLVLALFLGVWQWKRDWLPSRWVLFGPLWVFAALSITGVVQPTPALFVYGWPYFFLGVVLNWVHNREERPIAFAIVAAATLALTPFAPTKAVIGLITALVTAGAIYLVSVQGWLATMTLGRVLQYLGRISYSLYLVHMLFGTPVVRFGLRRLGTMDFAHASILIALCVAVSILGAHIMYVLIERPAVRLSHRLTKRREPVVAPADASGAPA